MTPLPFSAYPAVLPAGARAGANYVIDRSRVALRGPVPALLADRVEDRFVEEDVTVLRASPDTAAASAPADAVVPVYVLEGGPAAFVPTGRITVRFREGLDARKRAGVLHAAGYHITDVPVYAPHMAWIEAITGETAAALAGMAELRGIPDIEHVEAQLLTQRSLR